MPQMAGATFADTIVNGLMRFQFIVICDEYMVPLMQGHSIEDTYKQIIIQLIARRTRKAEGTGSRQCGKGQKTIDLQ